MMMRSEPGSCREDDLHTFWAMRLYDGFHLKTVSRKDLRVIHPGVPNIHSGPDFLCALIRMDHLIWAGNVELHVKASDWYRHGHHLDPAFNNVILHLSLNVDTTVTNSRGRMVESAELPVSDAWIRRYRELREEECWLPCHRSIQTLPDHILKQWLRDLFDQRNAARLTYLRQITPSGRKWSFDRLFFIFMARGFGLPVNGLPMEWMAGRIPHSLLRNAGGDLHGLESLFFGISGLLTGLESQDPYPEMLRDQFKRISVMQSVTPLPKHVWKHMRVRPASFPSVRIAQLAALVHFRHPLCESVLSCCSAEELFRLLRVKASAYWDTHYQFETTSPYSEKYTGPDFRRGILINVIFPYLEAMAEAADAGISRELLTEMKAESNHIIKNWCKFGIYPENALESQALIQLFSAYCRQKRCIECRLGRRYLMNPNQNE